MDTSDLTALANKEADPRPYRSTIIYGDTGKRKTTTACSMVNERGLLISADGSWTTLLNDRHSDLLKKITVVPYHGLSQIRLIDFDGYDTIIWDTFSHSVDVYLDLLYDEADWGGKYREKIHTDNKELKDLEILAPTDYRVVRDMFRPTLNNIFSYPVHWIFTSQVNDPIKGLSPDMTKKPAIPNSTFRMLARLSDIIGYICPVNNRFMMHLEENNITYLAKSRIQGIEGKMDVDKFVQKYKEIVF